MAKYTIERACGHTEVVQICGPTKDRDRKAEWEASRKCYGGFKADQAAARQAESAKAAEQSLTNGFAPLVGSEKQVAWAETIRARMLEGVAPLIERGEAVIAEGKGNSTLPATVALLKRMVACTSAKWWIDNRVEVGIKTWLQVYAMAGLSDKSEAGVAAHLDRICRDADTTPTE